MRTLGCVIVLLTASSAFAQAPWAGVLDPSRATDWSQAGIPGGIPNYTTVCQTVNPSGVSTGVPTPDTTAINTALANPACNGQQAVVQLTAGTYYTTGIQFPITGSRVVLRGAGPIKTIINSVGTIACFNHADICMGGQARGATNYQGSATWATGFSKGANSITTGAWTGSQPAANDLIVLDQRDDAIGICPVTPTNVPNGTPNGTGPNCAPGGTSVYGATESGNTVTITTSLPHGFSVGQKVNVGGVATPCPPNGCLGQNGNPAQWVGYVTNATCSAAPGSPGTVTLTFGHAVVGAIGDVVWISQVDPAGYNGTPTLTGKGSQTIQYTVAACPGAYVSHPLPGGGLVYDPIRYVGQWTITSVGCVTAPGGVYTYTASAGCGTNPINAFQYTSPAAGLPSTGGGQASVDNGGDYITCLGGPTCSSEGGSGWPSSNFGRRCPHSNGGGGKTGICAPGEYSYREQQEVKRVTSAACSGIPLTCSLGIDPPLENPNWRLGSGPSDPAGRNPGVWLPTATLPATNLGLENLTIDAANDNPGSYVTGSVVFAMCYECWAKNVRSLNGHRNHFWIGGPTARIEVVDSYIFGSPGATKSYGIEATFNTSDNLVQNNICQHIVTCIVVGADSGSVYGYNYSRDSGYKNPVNRNLSIMVPNHDFQFYDLFEGNDSNGVNFDNIHGSSIAGTVFRNRFVGQDYPVRSGGLVAAQAAGSNRAVNFIGNILGTPGVNTAYESRDVFPTNAVYQLDSQTDNSGTPNDPVVTATAMRWGNYDTANAAARWESSEVPTAGVAYISGNPVPASHTLPASFYLAAQPSWWSTPFGTAGWPAIGPDVSVAPANALNATCSNKNGFACDGVANLSYMIPAQLCFYNTPIDPNYQETWTVTSGSVSAGTATLICGTNAIQPGLRVSDTFSLAGSGPGSGYNGDWIVASIAASSNPGCMASFAHCYIVTYYNAAASGVINSGAMGWRNVKAFDAANCYGSSLPTAVPTPATISFGNEFVSTPSASQTVVLTNASSATLTITGIAITGTNSNEFSDTTTCGGSLGAGLSCNIVLTFTATSVGAKIAEIMITDNASDSPQVVALAGAGIPAAASVSIRGARTLGLRKLSIR